MKMEVRYNPAIPGFMLICSCFILFVSVVIGKFSPNTVTGIVLFFLSIMMLTRPMMAVTEKEIEMKNLLGMTLKRIPYEKGELRMEERGLVHNNKKMAGRFLYRNSDLNRIEEYLQESENEGES